MNLQEYISSGILEAYVLGALSAEEKNRVAKEISLHPELAAEVAAIEDGMYAYSKLHAVAPPAHLKDKIKAQLHIIDKDITKQASNVRAFEPPSSLGRNSSWQRAAIWVLLLSTAAMSILFFSQRNAWQKQMQVQNNRVDSLLKHQQELTALLDDRKKENDMLADTAMQAVVMKTMQPQNVMAATIYWGKQEGEVYLSFTKMPMPPQGKQYQLWVIQDGKPVSMGMVPNELLAKGTMMKVPMKVGTAQAFAISLENEGGNPTPTEVQVLGKIS